MTQTADNRRGQMRPSLPSLGLAFAVICAATGTVLWAVGRMIHSPATIGLGLALFIPLLVCAAIATVAVFIAAFYRFSSGSDWYKSPSMEEFREAGAYWLSPKGKGTADESGQIPLSEMPAGGASIRIEDHRAGQIWRAQVGRLPEIANYAGFRSEELADGFLMILPRTKSEWQLNAAWLSNFCIDVVNDRQLKFVIFDLNRPEDSAVRSVVSFLFLLDTQTLPEAAVRNKLRLANVTHAIGEALDLYQLQFHIMEKADWARLHGV